jgi:hypothetical protein
LPGAISKDTAVFVTEADQQSGVDHVDAHRSILLAMSPYVRNDFISHRHSSMSKTFPGLVRRTADPSAALGMTKGWGRFQEERLPDRSVFHLFISNKSVGAPFKPSCGAWPEAGPPALF